MTAHFAKNRPPARGAAAACWLALWLSVALGAERARSETVNVLYLGASRPLRLQVEIRFNGRPLAEARRTAEDRLFAFLDRNGDSALSRSEAATMPDAFALRQMTYGSFHAVRRQEIDFSLLDQAPADECVSAEELHRFYHSRGAASAIVVAGRSAGGDVFSRRLAGRLDDDRNGELSQRELAAAERKLTRLDANGDELVSANELVAGAGSPYAFATALLTGMQTPWFPFFVVGPDQSQGELRALLNHFDQNGDGGLSTAEADWSNQASAKFDIDADAHLSAGELRAWLNGPAEMLFRLDLVDDLGALPQIEAKNLPHDAPAPGEGKRGTALQFHTVGADWRVRASPTELVDEFRKHRTDLSSRVRTFDADRDGELSQNEVERSALFYLEAVLYLADADGNSRLSMKELESLLDIQQLFVVSHLQIALIDHGSSLFAALDADGDACLSVLELRTAPAVRGDVAASGRVAWRPSDVAPQLEIVVSRGQPELPHGAPRHQPQGSSAPAWFGPMDANDDGIVSHREFLGDQEIFNRFDTDGDGLITAAESASGFGGN